MAVPASCADRAAISRSRSRTNIRRTTDGSISRAIPYQIGNVSGGGYGIRRWLNIGPSDWGWGCRRWGEDFLLKIANHNIQRAAGQHIGRGIDVARLGELPVSGCTRHVSQRQAG